MPKEIQPCAHQCDCGHLAQFSANSVKDAKERSRGKKQWISEGQGLEKHMALTLERKQLIQRSPGQARSITVLVPAEDLPPLK